VKKIIWFLLGLMIWSSAFAEVPRQLSYSGKLTDKNNNLLPDGNYNMLFSFFTAATGGTAMWSEQHNAGLPTDNSVPVKAGGFDVLLGSVNKTLPDFSQSQNQNLWLQTEVWINGVDEVFGRRAISSVAYARQAEMANGVVDSCITSAKILNGTIVSADIGTNQITGGASGNIALNTITNSNIANGAIDTQAKAPWAPQVYVDGIARSNAKIECGNAVTDATGKITVTFPSAFSVAPNLNCTVLQASGSAVFVNIYSLSASQFVVTTLNQGSDGFFRIFPAQFYWTAIGY
jgi:hypothetical protein